MTRQEAAQFARDALNAHGLQSWSVRLNQNADGHFLGLCSYKDKCIILNAHHIDIHPTPDIINTIWHEVAHALCPGQGHNDVWATKAREIGCDNTLPCSNLSLSPHIIDAIRSGADVEVTFEEHTIRTPKYTVTRLQDKCEYCGKVAKMVSENTVAIAAEDKPDLKFIKLECGHLIIRKIPKGTQFGKLLAFGDPNCTHVWDKNNCILCSRKRPYDFQIKGMQFGEAALAVANGVCIFDEMGLGKTIQAGGILKFHPELWPTLWIVKSTLKYQTAKFLINWLGDEHVPQMIESSKDWLIPGLKHYIVGYDMLVPKVRQLKSGKIAKQGFDITQFDRVGIKTIILDECQQIKNVDSNRTQMVRRVAKGRKVIALSGTPWNNRGSELFPVLNMCDHTKFHSEEAFKRNWVSTFWSGKYEKEGGIKNIAAFKELTKDLIIRRERTEVLPELPLVNRTKLLVTLDATQEAVYDAAVEEFVLWYNEQAENIAGMHILAAMSKMRHLVAIAKVPATLDYVEDFVADTTRKLVIFTHHLDAQDMIYDELLAAYGKQMPVLKCVSGMNGAVRDQMVEQFNNSPRALMVASTKSAGEGLNLQTCCDCVLHERQWNPGTEEQAEGRFIRIGSIAQTVSAVYAHLEGLTTIDPQLDGINERKRLQFHEGMNMTEAPKWNEDTFGKDLAASIVNGYNAKKNRKILSGTK